MQFAVGDVVTVVKEELESFGLSGVVIDTQLEDYPNCVLVKFSEWNGESCEKTLYLKRENLKKEEEKRIMAKLTGYKAVAVCSTWDYHYAIYDDGNNYQPGDKVFVTGTKGDQVCTIKEIISPEEAIYRYGKALTAEVVTLLDTSAYDKRVFRRKEAERLKKDMDKIIREMDEVNKYEMYANQNPELKELLSLYRELV